MFALVCPGYWCAVCGRGCAGADKVHRQRGCSRRLNPNTLSSRPWARWGDKGTRTVSRAVARSRCAQRGRSGSKHLEFCALLLKVVLLCPVLCLDDTLFRHYECPCLITILSSFAESDVLRGDPPLNCQSTWVPHGACPPMVDAAEFESIAQCPQELPQMMAAGKGWWPVRHTRDRLHFYRKSLLSHENRCWIRGRCLGTGGGCEIQEKPKKKKCEKSNLTQFSGLLYSV